MVFPMPLLPPYYLTPSECSLLQQVLSHLCVSSLDVEELSVVTASNDAINGDVYKAAKLIVHPKYDVETMDYQYALVKVDKSFTFKTKVKAIKLPTEELPDSTKILVSGWGYYNVSTAY